VRGENRAKRRTNQIEESERKHMLKSAHVRAYHSHRAISTEWESVNAGKRGVPQRVDTLVQRPIPQTPVAAMIAQKAVCDDQRRLAA
jgi:hypothetical protein